MWLPLEEIVFDNTIEVIHCDTRDFHCNVLYEQETRIKLTEGYLFTIEQVRDILIKLKSDSGGECSWRMLLFQNNKKDISGWDWKYIRVWKTVLGGYGISPRSQTQFVKKNFFKHHVIDKEYLHAIQKESQ